MKLTSINIYPIKSLGGMSLQTAKITDRGLEHDRRWMVVDENGQFISQREAPEMALIQVELRNDGLKLSLPNASVAPLIIPIVPETAETVRVQVWSFKGNAIRVGENADTWITKALDRPASVVYMPIETKRHANPFYAGPNHLMGFTDGYPFLIIGEAALAALNSRLETPLKMDRFRPNFVFSGGEPFAEDTWEDFSIGGAVFRGVKPCDRCVITTVDQQTGKKGKEPLKTLADFRKEGNKVLFGQNLICEKGESVSVGDVISLH